MFKSIISCAAAAACLVLAAGCGPDTPSEDLSQVPGAKADPGYGYNDTGLGGGQGGAGLLPGSENSGKWVDQGKDGRIGEVDADGWRVADPSGNRLGMPVIYFAHDSDVLVPSEQAKVERIAAFLADKPELGLLIEGHCDQRGTDEYNRALGERRANAIRAALATAGVNDANMKTQSFGEDKPAVEGQGEAAWRQNRRGVPVPMIIPGR
ncbi:MAG: OmpA family protein [Lentisphaeria bacterium]|nr:OmpA family protein [Lentisphaeria bacterium]